MPPSSTPSKAAVAPVDLLTAAIETLTDARAQLRRKTPGLRLSPDACATIEGLLGPGAAQSEADLMHAVLTWAGITIGDVRLTLTPAQLAEVQYRAQKNGRSVADEMTAAIALIQDQVFGSGYVAPGPPR